jgi:uncharacterized protein YbjT (DUF2867 family)
MITILGATGNVGRKIGDILIKKGEQVRLVARSSDRLRPLVGKQAQALAGDALDVEFLVKAFKDADAVFTLIPPNFKAGKFIDYADKIGESIARALEIARVNHVVNLSSVGAELSGGTGPIVGLHNMEERLNRIKGLHVRHVRAAFFMENLLWNIDLIKSKGINGDALRGDTKFPMIATKDIAAHAAERLTKRDFTGSSVRYLLGQRDLGMIEATEIIGKKINKPGLAYVMFPYEEAEKGLIAAGLSPDVSRLYIEMSRAFNEGRIRQETRTAENTTPTSFETFCDEVFVPAYAQRKAA